MYHITKCSDLENEEHDIKINILVHEFLAVRKKNKAIKILILFQKVGHIVH